MSMQVFVYRKGEIEIIRIEDFDRYREYNRWVSLLHPDKQELEAVVSRFTLHPLVVEDIANLGEIPKVDEYAGYTFIVTDIPEIDDRIVTIHKLFLISDKTT